MQPVTQPATTLIKEIKAEQLFTETQVISMFSAQSTNETLPKSTQKALKTYPALAANLLITMSKNENIQQSIIEFIEKRRELQSEYIYVALTLYPIDGYRLAEKLALSNDIDNEIIKTASLRAGFDPALIFPATAAGDLDYRIVPLMESASITLYNQNEDSSAAIWFKAQSDAQWQEGLALQWEPIQGALSGSIVYLKPDSQYTVKVSLSENNELLSEDEYTFTTRAESPPIDPDKIYYLSDIYQGGQLDLEALGIEGSETGWAKVIGDGVTVEANDGDLSAVSMGNQNYVMLENVTTKGGERYGIHGYKGHHTWIKGCNISNYGRLPSDIRNGKAYSSAQSTSPINYDSGIYLERSGVVVIEDCEVHSPNGKANSWEYGHPNGPNAFQIWGKHDTEAYRGQYIVRNNRFYGAPEHRFNDVIEGRMNFERTGAFVRDSAIYNNYLAYANDDLIEIDGGQANVLVYNNEMTQGYAGISTAPNMIGPSYVFHNYIHDLGDERGKEWAAIKMGGIMSKPAGLTNVFENLVVTNRNGITASRVNNDSTLWVNARNNIIISRYYNNLVGLGIYDPQKYPESTFMNNLIYNLSAARPNFDATEGIQFLHPDAADASIVSQIVATLESKKAYGLTMSNEMLIPNFSQTYTVNSAQALSGAEEHTQEVTFIENEISSFSNQDKYGTMTVSEDEKSLSLTGNTWKKIPFDYTLTPDSMMTVTITNQGSPEIVGIALETDNGLSAERTFQFSGTQNWGSRDYSINADSTMTLTIPIGEYLSGSISYIVFALDNDRNKESSVTYSNISFYKTYEESSSAIENGEQINIGISEAQ
ncbi:hypothetical protein GMES_1048 [Paraglaciecola mesophila KMM 241]|uniref:Right handed beta helix domain-containing protein n=1 Tax=Paraglaciecola mesophila KMM 241 TaxID=1128912 RepID=K6YYX5_9ALTE|nr:right-handed parallel beta-helix repeat-containing protein [Paraglaciecola mesophila]GAC23347.1 hypothetical protein GMES_1048 [Paraglaciecola mesophila KMM 241]